MYWLLYVPKGGEGGGGGISTIEQLNYILRPVLYSVM